MPAKIDVGREVVDLRRRVLMLESDVEFRDKEIEELKQLLHGKQRLTEDNKRLKAANIALEKDLERQKCFQRAIAQQETLKADVEMKLGELQERYNDLKKRYKREKARHEDMRISKEQMKNTYENQIMELDRRINCLDVETQNLQKQNEFLETFKVKCTDLKQKLSDSDKALQEVTHKCTHLEEYLRSAMRTIQSQLKRVNLDFGLPKTCTDKDLLLRYITLFEKYINRNNRDTQTIRKLEKQLKAERELCTEREKGVESTVRKNRTEDALKISDLQSKIRKQQKDIHALQGDVHMYSSHLDKQKEEKEVLQEKLTQYKKAFLHTKSHNMMLQEVVRAEQEPKCGNNQIISNSSLNKKTPLPPISAKPLRQRKAFLTQPGTQT